MIRLGSFLILYLISFQTFASGLLGESFKTSDEIYLRGGQARYNLGKTPWSATYLYQDYEFRREAPDNGARVQRGDIGYLWKLNDTDSIKFIGGGLFVDTRPEDISKVVGGISYQKTSEKLQISVIAEKKALAETLRNTTLSGAVMTENRSDVNVSYLILPKLKLQGAVAVSEVSDGNNSFGFDAATMYGISPGWPWIWLGYGVSGLYFDENRIGYWSPKNFAAHGPRFDSSFPIYGDFSGILGANLNFYEEDKTKGDGFLIAGGLQWGRYDGTNVRVLYTKIRSGQRQSPWIYEGIQASWTVINF